MHDTIEALTFPMILILV